MAGCWNVHALHALSLFSFILDTLLKARLGQHSRGSSLASNGAMGDQLEVGSATSSQDEDGVKSFSAPGSPNLDRRLSVLSLDERSRLLSHSSLDDLTSPVSGEAPDMEWLTPHNLPSEQSYQFMPSSDSEDDDDEEIEVSDVLEEPNIHLPYHLEDNPQTSDEVAPIHSMDSNQLSEFVKEEEETNQPEHFSAPKIEVVSSDSAEDDQDLLQQPNSSSGAFQSVKGLSGFSFTRLTGRFLKKVRLGSASSKLIAVPETLSRSQEKLEKLARTASGSADLKQNVRQLLRSIRGSGGGGTTASTSDSTGDSILTESSTERQQWIQKCQKTSRTKFIFI